MTFGQRVALNVSPLLLRLGLAFVFIYTGAGKLFYSDMPVSGERAAYLANAGLIKTLAPPRGAMEEPAPEVEGEGEAAPEGEAPAEEGAPEGGGEESGGDTAWRGAERGFAVIAAQNGGDGSESTGAAGTSSAGQYTAADFPEPIEVHRHLGLVLLMHGATEAGNWPRQLSSPLVLNLLAWVAVLTEFFGGWLILLGFLSRVWALGLAVTMGVALWLTQIGPAMGTGTAYLGFLPEMKIGSVGEWVSAWKTLQLQVVLLVMSLAVFLGGPGKVSLDALLFRRKRGGATRAPVQAEHPGMEG